MAPTDFPNDPTAERLIIDAEAMLILRLLLDRTEHSRSSLATTTGLSASTVGARVDFLISQGLVRETGSGQSRGGRKPRRIQLNGDAGMIGCISFGVDRSSYALTDLGG